MMRLMTNDQLKMTNEGVAMRYDRFWKPANELRGFQDKGIIRR